MRSTESPSPTLAVPKPPFHYHAKLNNHEAAAYLGVKPETLAQWRYLRKFLIALPYLKIGRKIFYLASDLEAFVEACKVGGVRHGEE